LNLPGLLFHYLILFRICLRFRRDIRLSRSFCAVAHSAEFVSALWATAQNFAKRCGPQRRMALYEKTKNLPLWATAQRLIPRCGPQRRESFCAVAHSAKFDLPLWATAQRLFFRYGPQRRRSLLNIFFVCCAS
jgi:hypothetical protein